MCGRLLGIAYIGRGPDYKVVVREPALLTQACLQATQSDRLEGGSRRPGLFSSTSESLMQTSGWLLPKLST